jgi:peptidoglycan/LPS O-acetylase OafA/YrhL
VPATPTDYETSATPQPQSPVHGGERVPVLDGLRGLAILMVLVRHFALPVPPPAGDTLDQLAWAVSKQGRFGVDLFFVLSGFLITGILLDARGGAHWKRRFYLRRAVRILPLYYAVVTLLVLGSLWLARAGQGAEAAERMIGSLQWWYWTHTTNWMLALAGTYAAAPFHTSFLWSLAVEEQFYLVWPLFVGWLARPRLLRLCLALAAGSLLLRAALVMLGAPVATVYYATVTRLDPLALGGAIAVLVRSPGGLARFRPHAPLTAAICATAFAALEGVALAGWLSNRVAFVAEASLIALGFSAVLVAALTARPGTWFMRVLTSRALRNLGFYSYAIYIFHVFIREALDRLGASPAALMDVLGGSYVLAQLGRTLLGGGLAFAAALASWHLYEKHFLKLKRRIPMPRAAGAPAGVEAARASNPELAASVR